MNNTRKIKIVFPIVMIIFLSLFLLFFNHQKDHAMISDHDFVKTVCVGRYLIDFPGEATIFFRASSIAGWNISTLGSESERDFFSRMAEFEQKIKREKNRDGKILFESDTNIRIDGIVGKYFIYDRVLLKSNAGGKSFAEEVISAKVYVRVNGYDYVFSAQLITRENVENLLSMLVQLRSLEPNTLPASTGFCFDRGLMVDPLTADQAEFVSVSARFPNRPDVAIAFSSSVGLEHGETLLQRDAHNSVKAEHPTAFKSLRSGRKDIAGLPGEESLDRIREPSGRVSHGFMWESLGSSTDVYLPALVLELDTGKSRSDGRVSSSLNDTEVVALWDRILSSIRRRPMAEPQPTK